MEAMTVLGGSEAELFRLRDARQLIQQIDQQLDKTLLNIKGKAFYRLKVNFKFIDRG